ncbi:unnamed protein product, partial [Brenthis ino]
MVFVCSSGRVAVLHGRGVGHGHAHDVAGAHAGLHGLLAARASLRPAAAALRRLHGVRPHAPGPVALGHTTWTDPESCSFHKIAITIKRYRDSS